MNTTTYIRRNFDELFLLGVISKLAFETTTDLSDEEMGVVAALRRSKNAWEEASLEQMGKDLSEYNEEQISGIYNNTKGIYHEMEFTRIENSNGDDFYAAMFGDTNHPEFDIILSNQVTGETLDVQLKAGSETSYSHITDFLSNHNPNEILVTEEVADKLGLPSSGISNEEIRNDVESVVTALINNADDDSVWNYFPLLAPISIAMLIIELWKRKQNNEITDAQFKQYAVLASGMKTGKIIFLMALLSIPVVNVITSATILARFLMTASDQIKSNQQAQETDMGFVRTMDNL